VLKLEEKSKCHEHVQASTVAIFKDFHTFASNRSSITPVNDDQHKH
jgi:hypothetical protein